MKIVREQFEKFVEPSEEIVSLLKEKCANVKSGDDNYVESSELDFELNGFSYSLREYDNEPIQDEGKYQYGGTAYQLVEFDKSIDSYPNQKSTTKVFNLFVYVAFSRSGSYYSDWYYSYEKPIIQTIEMKHIERQVIEAHDTFEFVNESINKNMTDEEDEDDDDWYEDEE